MSEAGAMTIKTKRRTRAEAKRLMWEYYRDNKARLPKWVREYRETILTSVQSGLSAEAAFTRILGDVDCDTVPKAWSTENRAA